MSIDLRVVRAALLLAAAILFFTGAGLGTEHAHKTLIVWGCGFGLVTLDRLSWRWRPSGSTRNLRAFSH